MKVAQTCSTLCNPMDYTWNSPGQNTGVGSHSLLQGIFPIQELNQGLLHCRRILYQLSYQGKAPREKQQITYMGTPISLSADFSAEILQARREWHTIFKVMKGKNPQPRTPPSWTLIQIWWRNQKFYRQAKAKGIQNRQITFTTNVKGTSRGRKEKIITKSKNIWESSLLKVKKQ